MKSKRVSSISSDGKQESRIGRARSRNVEKEKYSRQKEICARASKQVVAVKMKKSG